MGRSKSANGIFTFYKNKTGLKYIYTGCISTDQKRVDQPVFSNTLIQNSKDHLILAKFVAKYKKVQRSFQPVSFDWVYFGCSL